MSIHPCTLNFLIFVTCTMYFWMFVAFHISVYQNFYNLIFYYNFFSRPVTAVSYLGSSHFDERWCLNQPETLRVLRQSPTIILWYCTVHLNHISKCPISFTVSQSLLTAQFFCLLLCRYVYLRYINVYISGSFLTVLCVVVANSADWTWQRSESSRHCLL
jgi:hypothetical protein